VLPDSEEEDAVVKSHPSVSRVQRRPTEEETQQGFSWGGEATGVVTGIRKPRRSPGETSSDKRAAKNKKEGNAFGLANEVEQVARGNHEMM